MKDIPQAFWGLEIILGVLGLERDFTSNRRFGGLNEFHEFFGLEGANAVGAVGV